MTRNYQVFVQLYDPLSQTVPAQLDTAPDCAINPTTRWEPGWVVPDAHIVALPTDLEPGLELTILVGMYDLLTFDRLPVPGWPNGAVELGKIEIGTMKDG